MVRSAILVSGGLDSFIGYWYLIKTKLDSRVEPVYVEVNNKSSSKEQMARQLVGAVRLGVLDCSKIEKSDAYIPYRNFMLVLYVAAYGFERIWLIVQKDEMSIPDRQMANFTKLARSVKGQFEVKTPFAKMDKTDMVKWYVENIGDIDKLLKTWSCYNAGIKHCGNCSACFRRWVALENNGIYCDSEWIHLPWTGSVAVEYKGKLHKYSKQRQRRILKAFELVELRCVR